MNPTHIAWEDNAAYVRRLTAGKRVVLEWRHESFLENKQSWYAYLSADEPDGMHLCVLVYVSFLSVQDADLAPTLETLKQLAILRYELNTVSNGDAAPPLVQHHEGEKP